MSDIQIKWTRITPTGSTIICPLLPGNDEDFLVEVLENPQEVREIIHEMGFVPDVEEMPPDPKYEGGAPSLFRSFRRGTVNLIVTEDAGFAENFRYATEVATARKLCTRAERVALFKEILYGEEK